MKPTQLLLVLMFLAACVTGCGKKEPAPEPTESSTSGSKIGQAAAALEGLTYIKGAPVSFEPGKVYVVEFWATWCPPCKKSIPHLTEIQKRFKDKGVTVIGVSNEADEIETVKSFVAEWGDSMDYTVAVDVEGTVGKNYMEAFNQRGIPTAFVVDGAGKVAWVGHPMGGLDEALAKAVMDSAAAETLTEAAAEPIPTPDPAPTAPPSAGQIGQKAASLDGLTYIKGAPVSFEADKVYVVEFWATWCPPCRTSIPHLTEIQKQFKEKGVTIIGISTESGQLDTVKTFVSKQGEKMEYTVAVDSEGKANANYMEAFKQRGIPAAFIVDGAGKVAWVGHPMDGLDEVLALVVEGNFDPEAYAKAKAEKQAAQRKLHTLYQDYFGAVIMGSDIEKTRAIADEFIEIADPEALNAIAWQILTNVPKDKRDSLVALKAAEKANTETGGENPMVLDTYALALFENGKFAEAIASQQKAIQLAAGNEAMQADMHTRLEQYKAALAQQDTAAADGGKEAPPAPSESEELEI